MGTLENRRKLTAVRGMGAALVGFAGWIVLYVVFGLIEPNIFTTNNMLNLLRSMAKYLLVGVGQGVILITGNIDLSIGSVVAMSAMISATMMSHGTAAIVAVCAAIVCCLAVGVINGLLVGKFKLPPFIATLGTMFCARGVAYLANGNRNTDAIVTGLGKEAGDAFQNFFYYGKTLGIYNAFWIAFDDLCCRLFPDEQDPHRQTHLRHRLERRRGEALRHQRLCNHHKGLPHQRLLRCHCRLDSCRSGRHGQHGSGQLV